MPSICYDNALRSMTVTSEETVSGYPMTNALDGKTNTQVSFADGGTRLVRFDNGTNRTVNCLGIAKHNLATVGGSIRVLGSNTGVPGSFTSIHAMTPASNGVLLQEFATSTSYRYFEIRIENLTGSAYIADIHTGTKLALERDQKHGFVNPAYADDDEVIVARTRGDNLAGITIKTKPTRYNFNLFYYSSNFMSEWNYLRDAMKQYPIYINWRDGQNPVYCWPDKRVPQPQWAKKIKDYYNIKMEMQGFDA